MNYIQRTHKLTPALVASIRAEYGVHDRELYPRSINGVTQQQLADRYGVTQATISLALRGETWKGVDSK